MHNFWNKIISLSVTDWQLIESLWQVSRRVVHLVFELPYFSFHSKYRKKKNVTLLCNKQFIHFVCLIFIVVLPLTNTSSICLFSHPIKILAFFNYLPHSPRIEKKNRSRFPAENKVTFFWYSSLYLINNQSWLVYRF